MAGKKSDPADTPRKGMSMRLADAIRTRVEKSAANSNRTIGSEIEHRLELSFKFDFTGSGGVGGVADNISAVDFISDVGSVVGDILRKSHGRGFSEIETRTSIRAALAVLISQHLWVGEVIQGPESSPADEAVKPKDLPPGRLGMRMAADHMLWDAGWADRAVIDDTLDGRVSNRWSGDGSVIELGEPLKPKSPRRDLDDVRLEDIETDPRFESAENLHLYKRIG